VIKGFRDKDTERVFEGVPVPRWESFQRVAYRRLLQLHAAVALSDLKGPGLSLEKLIRDRKGWYSIRINVQWRVCFKWEHGEAYEVEITDYH